jgi:hypothetical protein
MREPISRRDFLKISGVGSFAGLFASSPDLQNAAKAFESQQLSLDWTSAGSEKRQILARDLTTTWVSQTADAYRDQFTIIEKPYFGTSTPGSQEKEFANIKYRATKYLGIDKFILPVNSLQSNPVAQILKPAYLLSNSNDISNFRPGEADVVSIIGYDPLRANWLSANCVYTNFDAIVDATSRLTDPGQTFYWNGVDTNFYPTRTRDWWTGNESETQWAQWQRDILSMSKSITIPDAPIPQSAYYTRNKLQQLLPQISMPQPILTPSVLDQPPQFYDQKPGTTMIIQFNNPFNKYLDDSSTEPVRRFYEALKTAQDKMKNNFGKYYIVTEMIKRVLSNEQYTYDDPIPNLPSDNGINSWYTEGMQIIFTQPGEVATFNEFFLKTTV